MLEILTGTGLALSAGLNAYIPLLLLGLAGRFIEVVQLPAGWGWLENEWVLGILAVLLAVEVVADKIPAVDTVNDWLQTLVRPAAGGLAFGSSAGAETVAISDPSQLFEGNQWVPIVTGAVLALGVHLAKTATRPVANALTLGAAAPALSTAEDIGSVVLSVMAIVVPILLIIAIPLLIWWAVWAVRRARRRRAERADAR